MVTSLLFATTPAGATGDLSTPNKDVDGLEKLVENVAPSLSVEKFSKNSKAPEGFKSDRNTLMKIPDKVSKPITVGSELKKTAKIFLDSRSAANGRLAKNGAVVYKGLELNQVVQSTEDGLRINAVIDSKSGPTKIKTRIVLPEGVRIVTGEQLEALTPSDVRSKPSKGLFFLNKNNELVGGVATPWAKDANGREVPTYYSVKGDMVIQHVLHKDANYSYPIVADPWLGFNLISSAKWKRRSEGWTLMVSPTKWARANAPRYSVGVAGWNELYAKYKNKGLNKNLGGMKKQYICHQQFAFFKSTWNLDEWRPNVSYAQTVNSKCNPGGGKIID